MESQICDGCYKKCDNAYELQRHKQKCRKYSESPAHTSDKFRRYSRSDSATYMLPEKQKQIQLQTKIGREFGIHNKDKHNNCFLNAGIQILYAIPSIRVNFSRLDPNLNGPAKYKSFVKAIYEFFKKVDDDHSGKIQVYDPSDIRRELFKLHY